MIKFDRNKLEQDVKDFEESDKKELKDFLSLSDVKEAIIQKNFIAVYNKWTFFTGRAKYRLTAIFLLSDIDLLSYQGDILPHQFGHLPIETIELPDNIHSISEYAFTDCPKLKEITIPKSVTHIYHSVFSGQQIGKEPSFEINYKGTIDEWKEVNKSYAWNAGCTIEVIHCIDGDYEQ